jgi:hypothetical protein
MRYASILVVVLIAVSNFWSQSASATESALDMVRYCRNLERSTKGRGKQIRIPNTTQALECWGYMQAVQDMSVLVTPEGRRLIGSCPPEQTTLLRLIHIFVNYARSHRSDAQGNVAVTVIKALQEAFPCGRDRAAVR